MLKCLRTLHVFLRYCTFVHLHTPLITDIWNVYHGRNMVNAIIYVHHWFVFDYVLLYHPVTVSLYCYFHLELFFTSCVYVHLRQSTLPWRRYHRTGRPRYQRGYSYIPRTPVRHWSRPSPPRPLCCPSTQPGWNGRYLRNTKTKGLKWYLMKRIKTQVIRFKYI